MTDGEFGGNDDERLADLDSMGLSMRAGAIGNVLGEKGLHEEAEAAMRVAAALHDDVHLPVSSDDTMFTIWFMVDDWRDYDEQIALGRTRQAAVFRQRVVASCVDPEDARWRMWLDIVDELFGGCTFESDAPEADVINGLRDMRRQELQRQAECAVVVDVRRKLAELLRVILGANFGVYEGTGMLATALAHRSVNLYTGNMADVMASDGIGYPMEFAGVRGCSVDVLHELSDTILAQYIAELRELSGGAAG